MTTPPQITRAIHRQIEKALPPVAGHPCQIITYITRPLYLAYLVGRNIDLQEAQQIADRHQDGSYRQDIWGSEVVILDAPQLYSYSVLR